jgi:hypothetical protein
MNSLDGPTVFERMYVAAAQRLADDLGLSAADPLRDDPSLLFTAIGIDADKWQKDVLLSKADRLLMCCSRQSGKSQTAAALALKTALLEAPAEVLIVSRTQRQSAELLLKVKEMRRWLRSVAGGGRPKKRRKKQAVVPTLEARAREERLQKRREDFGDDEEAVRDSVLTEQLANGSRIISLPGKADTFVGFSPDLLIIDEASRVPDDTYRACRPMLAVSGGRLVCLSTPFGKRGFFYSEWERCEDAARQGRPEPWERYQVKVTECPRISAEFLEDERLALGDRWYAQEYMCSFEDPVGAVFAHDVVHAMIDPAVSALW